MARIRRLLAGLGSLAHAAGAVTVVAECFAEVASKLAVAVSCFPARECAPCATWRIQGSLQCLADSGGDSGAEELDGAHDLVVGHRAYTELGEEALVAEDLVLVEDLVYGFLGAADGERAMWGTHLVELGAREGAPATLAAYAVHHESEGRIDLVGGLAGVAGDVSWGVDADRQGGWIVAGLPRRLAVVVDQRREALRLAAKDSMKKPRPTMISARPLERRSRVANCWKTRTGSSEPRTATALVRRIRSVRAAAAARTTGEGRRAP
jgi:hypothetical protein